MGLLACLTPRARQVAKCLSSPACVVRRFNAVLCSLLEEYLKERLPASEMRDPEPRNGHVGPLSPPVDLFSESVSAKLLCQYPVAVSGTFVCVLFGLSAVVVVLL